jgi:VWFA-related protein
MKMLSLLRCLAFSALCQALAQPPSQSEPEVVLHEAPATFTSRVNLVSVPVVIRDKDGHAVGGLKLEDFQLFDKGKPQVITKFTIQTSTSATTTDASAASVAVDGAGLSAAASKPELPGRYVAYFFDDIHMQPGDLLQARQAANHHLDTVLDPKARAGIFTTSGRTTQDFTNDRVKLHDALNRIQPWTSVEDKGGCLQISYFMADYMINQEVSLSPFGINPSSTLAHAMLDDAIGCLHYVQTPPPAAGQPSGSTQADPAQSASAASPTAGQSPPLRYLWQVANTALQYGAEETSSGLAVLRDLITKMSAAPGSRTIILVSPGFILTKDHRSGENTILDSAIRAGVIVNSMDIRGVYTPLRTHTFDAEYGGNFGGAHTPESGQARTNAERDEIFQSSNILAELAYGTGGTVHNDNDFEGGLKELAGRPEYVYVLGFSPDNLKLDGTYHGLKVKLKDSGKFDIEARRGYWVPNRAVDPAEAAREELKETFFSRDEIADIPLDLHADFFKSSSAKAEISVVARLDAKGLKFRKTEERNNDTLTVVTGLFDQNGNYISGIERVVELRLRDRSLEVLENSGISVEQSFRVAPGRYIVRVVVKDSEGKNTAARNTGIEVP